jgi:hypothetical protein
MSPELYDWLCSLKSFLKGLPVCHKNLFVSVTADKEFLGTSSESSDMKVEGGGRQCLLAC